MRSTWKSLFGHEEDHVQMELEVWLGGVHVAMLSENRRQMAMVYTGEARPIGVPLVSMAMPVSARRYSDHKVRAFFRGLLPEGAASRPAHNSRSTWVGSFTTMSIGVSGHLGGPLRAHALKTGAKGSLSFLGHPTLPPPPTTTQPPTAPQGILTLSGVSVGVHRH